MIDFRRFYRHTAIYTAGNFVYRAASFLLVPMYVHTLSPATFGTLELITTTVLIIQAVLSSGVAHAAMRFYFEYKEPEKKNAVISTALIGSFLFAGFGALLCVMAAPWISKIVFHTAGYALAFRLACISLVLEISREINLSYIRARERSLLFIAMAVVQLVTQVGASIFAVVHLHLGVVGILSANMAATFCVWIVLTIFTIRDCGLRFQPRLLLPIARYSHPLMLSALSGSIFQSLDRYFLNGFVSLQALGMYALSMRFANVIPVFATTPFTNSYGPYRFSIMQEADARTTYARIARYYMLAAGFLMVLIAAFCREAVQLLASKEYWSAYKVVPLLIIPGALGGLNYCFQTGIYVQKSTKQLFHISIVAGFINLAGLILFIPRFGVLGAVMASVIAFAYTITHTYRTAQKLFRVPYQLGKIGRIFAVVCALAAISSHIQIDQIWHAIVLKLLFVALYPVVVVIVGAFEAQELRSMLAFLRPFAIREQARSIAS
ncbi:MAG: polysaccharide biosynthesis protein [Acidobacteriaceae bacterium]|nr:polysaccharide biosynthesis protein [Acidobacteriaceae bacterium]